jgi:hypothetical protein
MNGTSLPGTGTALPITGEAVGTEEYLPDQANASITNSTPRSMAIIPLWVLNRMQDAEINEGDGGCPPLFDAGSMGAPYLTPSYSDYPYTGDSGSNPMPEAPPADPKNPKRPYAWGFFDSLYPDSNGVCTATLNPSVVDLPDIPAHTVNWYGSPDQSNNLPGDPPGTMCNGNDVSGTPLGQLQPDQPATHVEYTWSNVKVLLQGASVGQQFWADLTITRDNCTARYRVAVLSPFTNCPNPDGGPGGDQSQCTPTQPANLPANPTQQQLYGSGLPVDVPTQCTDLNSPDGGASSSPNYVCMPTKTGP